MINGTFDSIETVPCSMDGSDLNLTGLILAISDIALEIYRGDFGINTLNVEIEQIEPYYLIVHVYTEIDFKSGTDLRWIRKFDVSRQINLIDIIYEQKT